MKTKKKNKLTDKQFDARVKQLLKKESKQPEIWHYISFADDKCFLGGIYLQAKGVCHAHLKTTALGANPGGEMLCFALTAEMLSKEPLPPVKFLNRLLSKEEMLEIHGNDGGLVKLDGTEVT